MDLNKVIKVYVSDIDKFLHKKRLLIYEVMSPGEIMGHYLEVLRYSSDPLYPFEAKSMIETVKHIEKYVTKKMMNDLNDLSDKDLIEKYGLKPQTVSSRYVSVDVENIKASAFNRVEVAHAKEMIQQQYDCFVERGWI
jgi:hypothetical protein